MEELDSNITIEIEEASDNLLNHGVVAFPTETVMGMGVVYDDELAYNRLNAIKKRPEDKPYTLMVENAEQISLFAEVSEKAQKLIDAFVPGPITLLLPVKKGVVPAWVTHGGDVIGIRACSDDKTKTLLAFTGKPLLVPSANISGQKPAMSSEEVKEIFGDQLDYVVSGKAGGFQPSTVLDFVNDKPKIVRKGPITLDMIQKVLGNKKTFKIAIGSDHGGFERKQQVIETLEKEGYEIFDVGTNSVESVDYPIYGEAICKLILDGTAEYGIAICTTGIGISIVCNKIKGIRCGIGYNDDATFFMRAHNNANVIAFGAKYMSADEIVDRVKIFLTAPFEGGRHEKRVNLIKEIENK